MALTVSVLTGGTNSFSTTSEMVNFPVTDFIYPGVVGVMTNTAGVAPATGGFAVNAQGTPDMTVAVSAGACYVTATPSAGNSQVLRVKNSASSNVTITANSTGGTRYDWIYVSISAANAANPDASASNVATLVSSRSTSNTTDNGTPPTYGTLIAIVTVANGASSITNGNIADARVAASFRSANTTSEVNVLSQASAATGNGPALVASGRDSNIDVNVTPKGTGLVKIGGNPIGSGSWTAWTPTVTSEGGTFASVSGAGRYTQVGKSVFWNADLTITTVGTATGGVRFTLPVTARASLGSLGSGRDDAVSGKIQSVTFLSTTVAKVYDYNNASPIAASAVLKLSGVYEAA